LTTMILNLIGKRIPTVSSASVTTIDPPPTQPPGAIDPAESFSEKLNSLWQAASAGQFAVADRIQKELVEEDSDPEHRKRITKFLLAERSIQGDSTALRTLSGLLDSDL